MRVFLAGLLLAAAVAGAVALNGYRTSKTECRYLQRPSETCAAAVRRQDPVGSAFKIGNTYARRWKPRWVLPASIFLAIAGAGAAAGVGTSARFRLTA